MRMGRLRYTPTGNRSWSLHPEMALGETQSLARAQIKALAGRPARASDQSETGAWVAPDVERYQARRRRPIAARLPRASRASDVGSGTVTKLIWARLVESPVGVAVFRLGNSYRCVPAVGGVTVSGLRRT